MNKYIFWARNWQGKKSRGLVEARNLKEAIQLIKKRHLVLVEIKPYQPGLWQRLQLLFSRTSGKQVAIFTRQLATMIAAGLPLTQALSLLEKQARGKMRLVVADILRAVEGGDSLTKAMKRHQNVFGRVYLASISAGEQAGVLEKVLAQLADTLEKRQEFLGKVKGAMIYPAIIITGMGGVIFIVVTFVIPKMASLYSEFGSKLPWETRLLMAIARLSGLFLWSGPALLGLGIIFWKMAMRREEMRYRWDEIKLKLPILGPLLQATLITDISRTLAMMISTGVPLIDGVTIVGQASGNLVYQRAFKKIARRVERGFPLADAMREQMIFPEILVEMVATGEQTGKLDSTLFRMAHFFEVKADQSVKTLTSAIEPLIMIVLGIGVGFLVFAVIMPIYNLTSQF